MIVVLNASTTSLVTGLYVVEATFYIRYLPQNRKNDWLKIRDHRHG